MNQSVETTVDHGSHKTKSSYERTDFYCPNCGERKVWCETGEGDYYIGVPFLCVGCDNLFYIPTGPCKVGVKDCANSQILNQIKETLIP